MFASSYSFELAFYNLTLMLRALFGLVHWISRAWYAHPNPAFYPQTLAVRHGVVDRSSCDWLN